MCWIVLLHAFNETTPWVRARGTYKRFSFSESHRLFLLNGQEFQLIPLTIQEHSTEVVGKLLYTRTPDNYLCFCFSRKDPHERGIRCYEKDGSMAY